MLEDIFMLLVWTVLICFTLIVAATIGEIVMWVMGWNDDEGDI